MEAVNTNLLEFGVATLTLPGESESGDEYLVKYYKSGVLVAVVDGLGHGSEAAGAARLAVRTLRQHAGETAISLVKQCHAALPGTRGVVMSLACFSSSDDTMTWVGVGNVEGLLMRADPRAAPNHESLLLRGGVIGGTMSALRATVLPISRGDTLVFATDGVGHDFTEAVSLDDSPQAVADRVMKTHGKDTDDALVLVARYVGNTP